MQTDELNQLIHLAFVAALGREVEEGVDFFDAGGNSLAAEAVLTFLSTKLPVELPGWLLLDYPTVPTLSAAIRSLLSD